MLHYSCDACKRPITTGTDVRHVVKIEVFPAVEDQACGCHPDGDDADHLEDVQDLLERLEDHDLDDELDEATKSLRFDLCDDCRRRFVRNPLGLKAGKKLGFSNN